MITGVLAHCKDKVMHHFEEKARSILMACVIERCDDMGMEHCDEIAMEHFDDMCHGAL